MQDYKAWDYARNAIPVDETKRKEFLKEDSVRDALAKAYDQGVRDTIAFQPECTYHLGDFDSVNLLFIERVMECLRFHGRCQIVGGRESRLYHVIADVLGMLKIRINVPVGE
jgi:hypothetical protein